jgi:hypothetical protein
MGGGDDLAEYRDTNFTSSNSKHTRSINANYVTALINHTGTEREVLCTTRNTII